MAAQTVTTTLAKIQGFNLLAIDTTTPCVVTCGFEDVAIQHLNLQASDTAAPAVSATTDYIIVRDGTDATIPSSDYDTGDATGSKSHKMIIRAGGSAIFKGADMKDTGGGIRTFSILAIGNKALVQIAKGEVFGDTP
jgi:hypothetical protein